MQICILFVAFQLHFLNLKKHNIPDDVTYCLPSLLLHSINQNMPIWQRMHFDVTAVTIQSKMIILNDLS